MFCTTALRASEEEEPVHEEEPFELNTKCYGSFLEVSHDKLSAHYCGAGSHGNDVGGVQAQCAVPRRRPVYYYEATVTDAGARGCIGVGFADATFKLSRQPGWEPGSYGYHGDDGRKYHASGAGDAYGPTFSTGDVVGAGIHFGRQEIFFTKNGKFLGVAFARAACAGLIPTLGLHSRGERVRVNFGAAPFVFDVQTYVDDDRAASAARVRALSAPPGAAHELVRAYLERHGYADTLAALDATDRGADAAAAAGAAEPAATAAEARADPLVAACARVRACVMTGDVDAVEALLRARHPRLLAEPSGHVPYVLACARFVEAVRRGEPAQALALARAQLAPYAGGADAGGGADGGADAADAAAREADLRHLAGLLAYADPLSSPLADLLSRRQRNWTADVLISAMREDAAAQRGGGGGARGGGGGASALERVLQHLVVAHRELRHQAGGHGDAFTLAQALDDA